MARIIALIAILYLLVGQGYAQQFKQLLPSDSLTLKSWTVEDGLPVNTTNQVTQDDNGFLWFTTYDGIVRFDGIDFKTFNHSNTKEIPHNRATEIYKQDGVGIWVSMEHEGVLLITDEGFKHFGIEEGFSKSDVTQILEDSKGRMFFTTHDGLYVYEDKKFRRFFEAKNEKQNKIRFLFEDIDGSKWIATNNGLIHISGADRRDYNVSTNSDDNTFFSVFRNSQGTLFAGSTSGLFILTNGEFKLSNKYRDLEEADVYRIFEYNETTFFSSYRGIYTLTSGKLRKLRDPYRKDNEAYYMHLIDSEGRLWLIGDRGTLSIYNKGVLWGLDVLEDVQPDYFVFAFEDREQNIWLTTPREGIIRIKKSQVKTIARREGLSEDNILGLLKDSKGRYWVGTRGGGLNLIEGNKVRHLIEHRDITSSIVQSIAEDSVGNIWIGHYQKGLNKISSTGISHYSLGEKFDVNNIHALYTARDGQLWVGTYGGVIKFDPEQFRHTIFSKEQGLSGSKVRYITEARDSSLWIGTLDGGISNFKGGSFTSYSKEQGLSSNNVRSIHVDESEEVIWVGTENSGLNRIKNGQITFIGTEDGLPDYNIHWISEDDMGWLWMSSNKGIFKILKSSLNEYLDNNSSSFRMVIFGRNEGMRNPEGNGSIQEAGIKDDDGSFWFATQEGVAIFNKVKVRPNKIDPQVVINKVTAKGEIYSGNFIEFEPSVNDFEIEVHAITFLNPEKTKYRYKLEKEAPKGDKDWVEVGTDRNIEFINIKPDSYKFTVQATNDEGLWSKETASIFITITPKYYQKVWFYLVCLFIAGSIFIWGWRARHQRLIRMQKELEEIIEEKTELLRREKREVEVQKEIIEEQAKNLELSNKAKDKFFSIIAHDLRNPFQAMIGFSEYLHSNIEEIDENELKESIGIIKNSTQSLLKLTENLLQWANLQTGNSKPEPTSFVLNDIINKNYQLFEQAAKQKDISLAFKIESEIILNADYNMIDTVIRNLLSNAVKFTENGGSVMMDAFCIEKECEIKISDTGIGMDEEMLSEVLSLGKSTSRKGTNQEAGTGIGLVLCKEMIELNNGTLLIESEENRGTTFSIKFPCEEAE